MSNARLYDAQTSFQGGMQQGFDPALVGETQYYLGINTVCRDGTLQPRPSFSKVPLDFSDVSYDADDVALAQANYDAAMALVAAQQIVVDDAYADFDAVNSSYEAALTLARANLYVPDDFVGSQVRYVGADIAVKDGGSAIYELATTWTAFDPADQPYIDSVLVAIGPESSWHQGAEGVYDSFLSQLVIWSAPTGTNQAEIDARVVAVGLIEDVRDEYLGIGDERDVYEEALLDLSDLMTEAERLGAILDKTFDAQWIFKNGKYQGNESYTTRNVNYTVAVFSGHIFLINLRSGLVSCLTTRSTQLNEFIDRVWMVQAEEFFIVQDGKNLPKILSGSSLREPDYEKDEIPVGRSMAYGHGRLAVQISDRHFKMGDPYLSYRPDNVLRFRETIYLNEGGGFSVQDRLGNIVTLEYVNVSDTSTGDGPLLAICDNGFSTFAVNNPRRNWSQIPIQKVQLIGSGIVGPAAFAHVNEDMLYRSHEGIRSYAVSRTEAAGAFKYTELSREVESYMQNDKGADAKFLGMTFFDKRMLALTAPLGTKAKTCSYREAELAYIADPSEANREAMLAEQIDDVCFKGIIAFDFSMAGYTRSTQDSQYMRQTTGSYDGVWTGLKALSIFTVVSSGERRCFAFGKSSDDENGLYEIHKETTGYDGNVPIECILSTRSFTGKNPETYMVQPFINKSIEKLTLWVDQIKNNVSIQIDVSPNTVNKFASLGDCELKAKTSGVLENGQILIGAPQSRAAIELKEFSTLTDDTVQKLMTVGNEFMIRMSWSGMIRIRRLLIDMMTIEDDESETHDLAAEPYPFDTFNQYTYRID